MHPCKRLLVDEAHLPVKVIQHLLDAGKLLNLFVKFSKRLFRSLASMQNRIFELPIDSLVLHAIHLQVDLPIPFPLVTLALDKVIKLSPVCLLVLSLKYLLESIGVLLEHREEADQVLIRAESLIYDPLNFLVCLPFALSSHQVPL